MRHTGEVTVFNSHKSQWVEAWVYDKESFMLEVIFVFTLANFLSPIYQEIK